MTLEVCFKGDRTTVGLLDERLALFIRAGMLTVPALEAVESLKDRLLLSPRPKGVLVVFTPTASASNNALVERQRVFARAVANEVPDISFANIVMGDSVHAIAIRTVLRVIVMGRSNMATFRDVGEGCQWLAGRMGLPANDLQHVVNDLVAQS